MNKTVIVTGASGGLGLGIAVELGKLGANVVVTARRADALEETARAVREAGGQAAIVAGDLTDPNVIQQVINTALEQFGQIDAVVNNASTLDPMGNIADIDVDAWRQSFEINVFAPLALIKAAIPELRKTHGRVINISSGASVKGYAAWGHYGASKAIMNHIAKTIASEEPHITALSVRPGRMNTDMQAKIRTEGPSVLPKEMYDSFMSAFEKGELLDPALPGHAIAVLALHAPPDWSGEYMDWAHEHIRRLSERLHSENQL